jgi:hypothetical protein
MLHSADNAPEHEKLIQQRAQAATNRHVTAAGQYKQMLARWQYHCTYTNAYLCCLPATSKAVMKLEQLLNRKLLPPLLLPPLKLLLINW